MPEKNIDLPGVEGEGVSQKKIKAVEDAFDELLGHRAKRMKAGEAEQTASAVLTALFEKHNLRSYVYDDCKYVIQDKKRIVRAPKEESNGEN